MKKFFRENAVTLSMVAFLVLVFIFGMIFLSLFLPDFKASVYGNRLDDIESYPLTDEEYAKFDTAIKNSGYEISYTSDLKGKLLTFIVTLEDYVPKEEISVKVSEAVISSFTEKNRGYYSFEVFVKYVDKNKTEESDKSYVIDGYLKNGHDTMRFNKF